MKKDVIKDNGKINHLGLFLQCILLVVLIILVICSLYIPNLKIISEFTLVALLVVMGYNNYTVFKRKGWSLIYGVAALLVLIATILGL